MFKGLIRNPQMIRDVNQNFEPIRSLSFVTNMIFLTKFSAHLLDKKRHIVLVDRSQNKLPMKFSTKQRKAKPRLLKNLRCCSVKKSNSFVADDKSRLVTIFYSLFMKIWWRQKSEIQWIIFLWENFFRPINIVSHQIEADILLRKFSPLSSLLKHFSPNIALISVFRLTDGATRIFHDSFLYYLLEQVTSCQGIPVSQRERVHMATWHLCHGQDSTHDLCLLSRALYPLDHGALSCLF